MANHKRIMQDFENTGIKVTPKKSECIIKDLTGIIRKFTGEYTAYIINENEITLGGITIETGKFMRNFKKI